MVSTIRQGRLCTLIEAGMSKGTSFELGFVERTGPQGHKAVKELGGTGHGVVVGETM